MKDRLAVDSEKATGKKCSTTRESTVALRASSGRRPRSGAATPQTPEEAGTHVQGRMTITHSSTKKGRFVGRQAPYGSAP